MKKIQNLMLMLLAVVMGMTVQSCGSETKTEVVSYVYAREPLNNLSYDGKILSQYTPEEIAAIPNIIAFAAALSDCDESLTTLSEASASDSKVLQLYQRGLANFTSGMGFEGYLLITKARVGSDSKTEVGRVTFTK